MQKFKKNIIKQKHSKKKILEKKKKIDKKRNPLATVGLASI